MGRVKADGSGPVKFPEDEVVRPAGVAEDTVRLEQRSCLVILPDEVLCHVPSMKKRHASGDGFDLTLHLRCHCPA